MEINAIHVNIFVAVWLVAGFVSLCYGLWVIPKYDRPWWYKTLCIVFCLIVCVPFGLGSAVAVWLAIRAKQALQNKEISV